MGGGRRWQKREHLAEVKPGFNMRPLPGIRRTAWHGGQREWAFPGSHPDGKMSHQLRQETQGGVSSGACGIPLEWIAGFLHFQKKLLQMSLSAGLSNKQPEV